MRLITFFALLAAACSSSATGPRPNETCSGMVSCGTKGSYEACTDGTNCRLLASDGSSFNCTGCSDCAAATSQAVSWCSGSTGTGGVQLTVTMATTPSTISSSKPSAGRGFVVLDVTVANASVPTPIPVAITAYKLITAGGLSLTPSGLSSLLSKPCPADVSVTAGAQYACEVAFEVPTGDTAATLNYDDLMGHKATATVPAPVIMTGTSCEPVVIWGVTGSSTCKACVSTVKQSGGPCYSTVGAFTVACGSMACSCSQTTAAAACACVESCLGASCWSKYSTAADCVLQNCKTQCP
jgi:hypothetical protein